MAKSAKETREEIEALKAMLAGMDNIPDDTPDTDYTAEKLFRANSRNPNEIVEITRKVKRKHFTSIRYRLTCEECEVDFDAPLPARYDGRLCGENCASIALEKARELLAAHYSQDTLPRALQSTEPPHLQPEGPDPTPVPGPYIEDTEAPERGPVEAPLTLEEKIRLRLKSS